MLALFATLLLQGRAGLPEDRALYRLACGACHGDSGDGRGEAARLMDPAPAELGRGVFKLRSTPTGSLPTNEDLARTVRRGVPGTAMPAYARLLSEEQIRAVARAVQSFSVRFEEETAEAGVQIPTEPADDRRSQATGARLYRVYKCAECHGPTGRGDGPAARTLLDDRGSPSRAYDFTTVARMKGGDQSVDIYRTLATGMDGSPMPSYADAVPPDDLWHLAHYVRSLVRKRTWWDWLLHR